MDASLVLKGLGSIGPSNLIGEYPKTLTYEPLPLKIGQEP